MADKELKVKISATDNTKSTLDQISSNISDTFSKATVAVKAFVAAFVIDKIGEFFSNAIGKAVEAERSFIQVGTALRNIGVNATSARPQIDDFVRRVSDISGVKVEDVQNALAILIRRTGDLNTAQKLLLPTLDVAAAKQIDVAKAADLEARAHDGQAKALKQVMNTAGAAADQNTGYIKTLNQLHNAWTDVLVKLGDAILKGDGLTKSGNNVVDSLKKVSQWIEDHHKDIESFRDTILSLAGAFLKAAGSAIQFFASLKSSIVTTSGEMMDKLDKLLPGHRTLSQFTIHTPPMLPPETIYTPVLSHPKPIPDEQLDPSDAKKKKADALQKEIEDYTKLVEVRRLTAVQQSDLLDIQDALNKKLDKGNLSLDDEVKTREQLLQVNKDLELVAAEQKRHSIDIKPEVVGQPDQSQGRFGGVGLAGLDKGGLAHQDTEALTDQMASAAAKANQPLVGINDLLAQGQIGAKGLENGFMSLFTAIGSGQNVWKSLGTVAKAALADMAKSEAKWAEGKALEALGKGIAGAPSGFAEAAEYSAAAVAFSLLAGGLSSGASGGGGGGGGGSSQSNFNSNANTLNQNTADATFIIQGGLLDMTDPRQQQAFVNALSNITSRRVVIQATS